MAESRYKGYTQAQGKRTAAYLKENREEVRFWVCKGERSVVQQVAEEQGYKSTAAFLIDAVNAKAGRQVLSIPQSDERKQKPQEG